MTVKLGVSLVVLERQSVAEGVRVLVENGVKVGERVTEREKVREGDEEGEPV